MKIKTLFSLGILGISLFGSCSGNNSDKSQSDSADVTDSLKVMEEMIEKEKEEAAARDSLLRVKAEEIYDNGLTITPGKKVSRHIPETSCDEVKWTCTVTNNTGITLSADDYQISYRESYEGQDKEGYLVDMEKTQTMKGPELAKDGSAEVVLKGKECTLDLSKPAVKLTISKEDFIKKYVEEMSK